jgi:hypothetical protein
MDRDVVNRALYAIGQNPLSDEDTAAGNDVYLLCKNYYLRTFLEALTEAEWTGGRKRDKLMRTRLEHLEGGCAFTYDAPFDCAKPIALLNNEYFTAEGRFILSDAAGAELLYVSNGRVLKRLDRVSGCGPGDIPEIEYLSGGWPDTEGTEFITCGTPADALLWEAGPPPLPDEDYPDYRPPLYEPKFYEYVEKKLAAGFAMRIAGDAGAHALLLQEAALVKKEAVNASLSARAAKRKPARFWADELTGGD